MRLLLLLLASHILFANDSCSQVYTTFIKEERAYLQVKKINIASNTSQMIVEKYLKVSKKLLSVCPNEISLDKQYVLAREVKKLQKRKKSYKVAQLYELRNEALNTKETITVYKNGTITPR